MSMENECNLAARYRNIRKHLDNLGYKQALTLDSLPLIEKLLADLIQTTESLKHFKSIAQENIEAYTQLQSTIDPYKCDNVRLVQECNQLHLDLIKEKECHQKQIKDLKKEIYKLERECNDLQLASSRNLHRIKELEAVSAKKSKRILELQGKCLKPSVSNVGLVSKKRPVFPLRRPVIESEPLPKTGVKVTPLPNLSVAEPKIVDLLSMADHKMNSLSHEVTKLKGDLSLQIDDVQTLKSQLTMKEKEILRLKKMLEGGRPYLAVSKDCACKKAESSSVMSNYNIDGNELKVLRQEKLELEQQLKEALNKQHDAMSQALKLADQNEKLEKELEDIARMAIAFEAECIPIVEDYNGRISKLQEELENVMARVHALEAKLTVERREVQELRVDLEACNLEKHTIECTLESTLYEKKQMTDRINELTVIEKNLNDEIERLIKENEKQREDIIQLQYSNKLLKEQINRREILLDDVGINLKDAKEKGRNNDYDRGQGRTEFQEAYKGRDLLQSINDAGYEKEIEINDLQQAVEQLRRERDFYKNEYENIKDNYNKTIEKDHVDLWSRIRELECELNEKENALDELQREKKDLHREKTNLETRLQTYKTERKAPYRPCNVCKRDVGCNCSPPLMRDVGKTKNIIERLEHERDIARADVDRLIEERDALRERLKMAAEAHTSEQRRLKESLTDVETRLKQIEKERQELLLAQGAQRATINGLEDQLQDLREELKRTEQELGTQRTQYFQLRALQDQTDQALGDAQNQLTQSESELNKTLDRNRTMERQKLELENQVEGLQQEIKNLKAYVTYLDYEKDQLLMDLDEKIEMIDTLEKKILTKDKQVIGSEQQIHDLQHKNQICVNQSADQDRQLRSMQLEVENLQRQLQTASCDKENAIQENRRIQDDLAAATCEVRNLKCEIEASRAESYDLKRQLQTYVSEVRRVEELLNRKENERTEMLNHFRSLSLEATVLENNNHSLESEAAEARGALQSARDRLLDLERQLADKDSLIRGYETQISELTQSVAIIETQLRQQGEQKHRAEADLTAVRDLCMKLDQQKDTLMQQLDDKDALKTQYDMQITKLKAEQAAIHDQASKDCATVERLEMLLDQARQESITVQANNQELQNEVSRLRQKMSELQSKLSSESTKLRQYQTQAAEYCKQISELRRQVTHERFDRARKEEEHRSRYSEGLPDPLVQTPLPSQTNDQIPDETTDANHRYLQNETSRECDGQTEKHGMKMINPIAVSRSRCLNLQNKLKRSNHAKDAQRDVPCINIILRSDCKMHSNRYNRLQKESTSLFQPNADSIKTNLQSSNMLRFYSFNKKYSRTVFRTESRFDMSQSVGTHYEGKYDRDNDGSIFSNISQLGYNNNPPFLCHPVRSNEISDSNAFRSNSLKTNLFSQINGTKQLTPLSKDTVGNLGVDDIKANFNESKLVGCPVKFSKKLPTDSFPVTNLASSMKQINGGNGVSKMIKTDLSLNSAQISNVKENSIKLLSLPMNFKSPLENSTNLQLKSPNMLLNSEFMKLGSLVTPITDRPCTELFYASSPTTSSDVTRNFLKNNEIESAICINETISTCKDKREEHEPKANCQKDTFDRSTLVTEKFAKFSIPETIDICSNVNCNEINRSMLNAKRDEYEDRFSNIRNINDYECVDKCTSTIDDALDILQNMLKSVKRFRDKDTKKCNDQNYRFKEVKCKNMDCIYKNEGNKVLLAKINSAEITRPKCMKMLREIKKHADTLEEELTTVNKSIRTKKMRNEKLVAEKSNVKQHSDMITQNPEKKNIYIQEPCSHDAIKYSQSPLLRLETNFNSQHVKGPDVILSRIHKKGTYKKDHNKIDNSYKRNNIKSLIYPGDNYSTNVTNAHVQCARSVSFRIFDSSNFRPIATSTPRNIDAPKNKETLCCISTCTQTTSISEESLQMKQVKKTTSTELNDYSVAQENKTINSVNVNKEISSCCDEKAIIMLFLTKNLSNKCLKTKYKRSEFLNFRSKCLTGTCVICGKKKLIKYGLSRRKKRIPAAFKLMSVTYKSEAVRSNGNHRGHEKCSVNNCKVSDLLNTVYTQSSNLQITTATSVPCISVGNANSMKSFDEERTARNDGCILS